MSSEILTIHNLSYAYQLGEQTVPVLSDISLSIKRGEMVAIQGASGSGKSTLLYLLGGLLRIQEGSIFLDNCDLAKITNEELAYFRNLKIGYIFQQFHLLPKINLLGNILLPTDFTPTAHKKSRKFNQKKATELANFLGLSERLFHYPSQLSGGQQQRVAIARALMNDPEIILADEPTGNLDSHNSQQILGLLKELNRQGKTIIIITHDSEVASGCDKIFHIKDGKLDASMATHKIPTLIEQTKNHFSSYSLDFFSLSSMWGIVIQATHNLLRNKIRSVLTMLGITIGIASIISMLTLGLFTKEKIIDSYTELGVNTLMFQGYPKWDADTRQNSPVIFEGFDWKTDLKSLPRIFPEIKQISPIGALGQNTVYFGNKNSGDIKVFGLNEHGLHIANRKILMGNNLNSYHIEHQSSVCVVGPDLVTNIFGITNPLGNLITIKGYNSTFTCSIIGVIKSVPGNKDWITNKDILVPYTFLKSVTKNWWDSRIHEFVIEVQKGVDMEMMGKSLKGFFFLKYGKSGQFFPNSQTLLINHMQKFLDLFTILLAAIAAISLIVGGIGVTNMMLVSVSERFREIGLKKALGATDRLIRQQFLFESLILCFFAGTIGIILGVVFYEFAIWGATQVTPKLQFEWVFSNLAFAISTVSIIVVGLFSGLFPAFRAEKLQVIEVLRSE